MVSIQGDTTLSGSIIARDDLLSDSLNWPEVPYDYLFLNQCEDKPSKQAVIAEDGSLTYQELDRLSLQWAHWLRSEGIKEQDKVLVCMERTVELPAVLLGIMRAGACYVPVDPAFPRDRIAVIIEDSGSICAVSDRKSQHLLPINKSITHLIAEERPPQPDLGSLPSWNPEALAYLIFTSGSTGRPKGVPITRAAMVNFLLAMARKPGIEANDRVLALTTISFDISILELFLPFIAGATVYLVSRKDSLDPQSLSRIITDNQLTLLQATPATWRLLYDFGWRPHNQQRLLCGGEAFPAELAQGLAACAGEVWNMYGPTEATVWSSCHRVTERDLKDQRIPLGSPLPNVEYLVIDESDSACPRGRTGELLIAGVAITPGYYGRPELNEAGFIYRQDNGHSRRFYRTGDLVRENSHGELIYIDRLDNQVKIRGFRVELGEIEALLSRVVNFGDSAVIVANFGGEETVLVGCIQSNTADHPSQIEAALSKSLPSYMIPRVWRRYSELPKTPNRKIDRKALRRLVEEEYVSQQISVDDFTDPLMTLIARHWKLLLGAKPTQETDDFLAMGGHSLLAARLSVALSDETGRYIRPVELLAQSSLAGHFQLLKKGTETAPAYETQPLENPRLTGIPFSSAQKRMWYIVLSGDAKGIFNESEAYRIDGKLDLAQLRWAIQQVIDKHVALRMVVESEKDLTWRVLERAEAPLQHVPISDEKDASWGSLPVLLHEEASRSFRFSREPLIRFIVYTDGVGQHVIQFVAHHLIVDGLSETLLWRELADFYQQGDAQVAKRPKEDSAFLAYLNSPPLEDRTGLDFWLAHLLTTPQVDPFDMKTDFPRPAKLDYAGKEAFLDLPNQTADSVRELAKHLHTTPFMVFLTVYLVWLNRHSSQGEYTVGTPVSGREPHWPEDMIGLFMNTIPLRLKCQEALPFSDLVSAVSAVALEAMRHDHIPFDRIVQEINPERDPSRTPIYQVLFAFNDYSQRPSELSSGINWSPEPVNVGFSPVDLAFFADLYPDRLRLRFQGSDGLFRRESIERFLRRYAVMLQSVITAPDQVCGDIPALDQNEKKQLEAWRGEARAYPKNASIDQCFQGQVAMSPDSAAIETSNVSLSYRELSRYADSLALSLRESGVKEGDRVGVTAEQSLEAVAGILGILRAGCVYVPMDLSHPLERLRDIAGKANVSVVLLTKKTKQSLDMNGLEQFVLPVVIGSWSDVLHNRLGQLTESSEAKTSGQSPAYVMFTSGSTGTPKGIEVTHQNVVRLVINNNFMTLDAGTRFLMYAPVAFDASTLEIWGPLLNGGTLVIPDDQPSIDQLKSVLAGRNVNCLWLTAALFHYMAEHAPSAFAGLKYLLSGGDVLSPKWVRSVLSANPGLKLINGYGPTENTTFTCCHLMASPDEVPSPVPIGKPIANTWVYVLDQNGNDCPTGIPGELYVGGDGVALGYVGDPKLTERSFLENPFGKRTGRVYRTGDKVCWRSDGTLEFLGRYDNQMKIRGFRIEPDEINEVIESYPGIEHAITVGWTAPSGDIGLVSYVTPSFISSDDIAKLQSWLARKLPRYMLPARLIGLGSLPVGLTGKVDRNRLPDPLNYPAVSGMGKRTLPVTPTEKVLAGIWKQTLGVEEVYCEDDFFALGGSSIKALEVFGCLANDLKKDIPLSTLLEYPTLSELARELDGAQANEPETGRSEAPQTNWNCMVKLGGTGNRHPIVCVHAVGGNVLSYRRIMEVTGKGRSLLGFQSRALDGKTRPQSSLRQMAKDYAQELLASGYEGPYTLIGGSLGGTIALEMAHVLMQEGGEVDWVILLDTIGPNGRDLDDSSQEANSLLHRIRNSVKARRVYYSLAGFFASCLSLGFRIPYNLRPIFIEQQHKKLLSKHVDKEYRGNAYLIRGLKELGGVYRDPYLGWRGVLMGKLKISEIDVSHDVFMESPETTECLRSFFSSMSDSS